MEPSTLVAAGHVGQIQETLAISGEPSMPPVSDLSGCGACGTGVEDTG